VRFVFLTVKWSQYFVTENAVVLVLASWFVDVITQVGTRVFLFSTRTAVVHTIKMFTIFVRIFYGVTVVMVNGNVMCFLNGIDVIFIMDSYISSMTGVGVHFHRLMLAFVSN
jgi:hypothetical protein